MRWMLRALACCVIFVAADVCADDASALLACRSEPDDAKRLHCYDKAMKSPLATPAGEDFGVRGGPLAREQEAKASTVKQIRAKLAALATKPYGELVLTLDNGQVWEQLQAAYFPLRPGDDITIKSGALGSYILVAPSGRGTKVRRLQ